MAVALYLGDHGPVAPHVHISKRWPISGREGALWWLFDGEKLRIVRRDPRSREYSPRRSKRRL